MIRDLARRLDRLEAGRKQSEKAVENLLRVARSWKISKKQLSDLQAHELEMLSSIGEDGTMTWNVFEFLYKVSHPAPAPDEGSYTAATLPPVASGQAAGPIVRELKTVGFVRDSQTKEKTRT